LNPTAPDGRSKALSPLFTWRTALLEPATGARPRDGVRTTKAATMRFVALVLSTYMSERGDSAFPSLETLAADTNLSRSTVAAALAELVETGWLVRESGGGRHRSTRYASRIPGAETVRQSDSSREGGSPTGRTTLSRNRPNDGGKPSDRSDATTSRTTNTDANASARAPDSGLVDRLFDALAGVGIVPPTAKSPRAAFAKLVRELAAAGATPEQVRERADAYRQHPTLGETMLTLAALAKWWDQLAGETEEGRSRNSDAAAEKWVRTVGLGLDSIDDVALFLDERVAAGRITLRRRDELVALARDLRDERQAA